MKREYKRKRIKPQPKMEVGEYIYFSWDGYPLVRDERGRLFNYPIYASDDTDKTKWPSGLFIMLASQWNPSMYGEAIWTRSDNVLEVVTLDMCTRHPFTLNI